MSTDHPNGGSFLAYPQIIRLLMDRTYRRDVLKTVHPKVAEESGLADIDRQYTLKRNRRHHPALAPARILGLKHKGHLGPGADADITIYNPHENKEVMFELPHYVIKGGEIIVEEGEVRASPIGRTLHVSPGYDAEIETDIAEWFEQFYSIRFRNYPVTADYLHDANEVACNR